MKEKDLIHHRVTVRVATAVSIGASDGVP